MPPADRTLTSRHECKYFVPRDSLPALRALSRPFVRPDRFAARSPGRRYLVSSVYLDDPGYSLYHSTVQGHRNRFKLRIRAYSDDPATPVWLEIKKRSDRVVRKVRVPVGRAEALGLLRGDAPRAGLQPDVAEFLARKSDAGAAPVLRVRYEREAYESLASDPVRMTFDTELCYAPFDPRSPFEVGGRGVEPRAIPDGWIATPVDGAIVEFKFTDSCPSWMSRLVDELELQRESIPKYVLSVAHAMARGVLRESAFAAFPSR